MLLFALLFSCTKKTGSITYFNNPTESANECVWAQVQQDSVTSALGIKVTSEQLSFTDQLYYCCPSAEGKPVCQEAVWNSAGISEPQQDMSSLEPARSSVNAPPQPESNKQAKEDCVQKSENTYRECIKDQSQEICNQKAGESYEECDKFNSTLGD